MDNHNQTTGFQDSNSQKSDNCTVEYISPRTDSIEQEEDKNPGINGRLDRNVNQNLHGDALENMSTKSWPPRYFEPRKILTEKQKKNRALYSEFIKMFRTFHGFEPDITNKVFADCDVQSRVEQDKVLRRYGVKNKGKPSFLIFTITKDYELICEVYLEQDFQDNDFLWKF